MKFAFYNCLVRQDMGQLRGKLFPNPSFRRLPLRHFCVMQVFEISSQEVGPFWPLPEPQEVLGYGGARMHFVLPGFLHFDLLFTLW